MGCATFHFSVMHPFFFPLFFFFFYLSHSCQAVLFQISHCESQSIAISAVEIGCSCLQTHDRARETDVLQILYSPLQLFYGHTLRFEGWGWWHSVTFLQPANPIKRPKSIMQLSFSLLSDFPGLFVDGAPSSELLYEIVCQSWQKAYAKKYKVKFH